METIPFFLLVVVEKCHEPADRKGETFMIAALMLFAFPILQERALLHRTIVEDPETGLKAAQLFLDLFGLAFGQKLTKEFDQVTQFFAVDADFVQDFVARVASQTTLDLEDSLVTFEDTLGNERTGRSTRDVGLGNFGCRREEPLHFLDAGAV